MIEAFLFDRADETFGKRIQIGAAWWQTSEFDAGAFEDVAEGSREFPVTDQVLIDAAGDFADDAGPIEQMSPSCGLSGAVVSPAAPRLSNGWRKLYGNPAGL